MRRRFSDAIDRSKVRSVFLIKPISALVGTPAANTAVTYMAANVTAVQRNITNGLAIGTAASITASEEKRIEKESRIDTPSKVASRRAYRARSAPTFAQEPADTTERQKRRPAPHTH